MGDRGAAGQPQRGAHLGGDDHRQRGLAQARAARRAGRGRRAGRAAGRPRAPGRAGRAPGSGRPPRRGSSDAAPPRRPARRPRPRRRSASRGVPPRPRRGGRRSEWSRLVPGRPERSMLTPGSACAGRRAAAPRRRARRALGGSAATASTALSASLTDQPRPTRPCCTWPRHASCAAGTAAGAAVADRRADAVLELEDHPLGALLADAGHPGQRLDVLRGDRACAARRGRAPPARPGPASDRPRRRSARARRRSSRPRRGSRRASGSPRGPPSRWAARPRGRCAAWRGCRACTSAAGRRRRPRARRWVRPTSATVPRTNAITGVLLWWRGGGTPGPRRCGPGRRRARCG